MPFSHSPIQLNKTLDCAEGNEFREKLGDYIEKYGGLSNPGFSYNNIFKEKSESGWNKLLGIINETPIKNNTLSVIKNMKAKKKIINSVLKNKNKELLIDNENILKCFAYETFLKVPHSKSVRSKSNNNRRYI